MTRFAPALAFALLAAGSVAHAEIAPSGLPSQPKSALNLSDDRVTIGAAAPVGPDTPVANRTSVEHTFGPQKMTVEAGYLCGLQPPSDHTPGPASTFGPISTFLGGKLSYAFK